MRKTQAQPYIVGKELWDINQHLYDFHLFQYTNASIERPQRLIDKSRNGYVELLQYIKSKQGASARYFSTIGNRLSKRLKNDMKRQ